MVNNIKNDYYTENVINKENSPPPAKITKPKKSVRMTETIDIKEENGEVIFIF